MALNQAKLESAASGNTQAMRDVLNNIRDEINGLNAHVGRPSSQKIDVVAQTIRQPPAAALFSVTGIDGRVSISITNPQNQTPQTQALMQAGGSTNNLANAVIYHEISSCASPSFDSTTTTYPVSTATSAEFSLPNSEFYWRLRSSYDQITWNTFQVFPSLVQTGGLTSGSTSPNVALNQSNFATVDSVAAGVTPLVRVYGAGGVGTAYPRQVGLSTAQRPGATLLNIPYGSNSFVAYDGTNKVFQVQKQLPQTFPDGWEPVGFVSVIFSGTPSQPTLAPVLSGGFLVGLRVITVGNQLTTAPIATVNANGTGSGAAVTLFVTNGQVTGFQIVSCGDGLYTNTTTVTTTGGVSGGAAGGGGTTGGNGGRFYSNGRGL